MILIAFFSSYDDRVFGFHSLELFRPISSISAEDRQALREVNFDIHSMHRSSSLLAENRQHMQKVDCDIRRQLIQDESKIL